VLAKVCDETSEMGAHGMMIAGGRIQDA
jgi:hypothetical protein